jgi:CheY-like chemotaxis protein
LVPTPRARILIVDDEPDVRAVLGEYLEGEGCEILFAETAIGALGVVNEHHANVVLLDLNMPGAVHGDRIDSVSAGHARVRGVAVDMIARIS